METKNDSLSISQDLIVTPEIREYLTIIRKWTFFFAVLGIIGIGLMLLAGIAVGAASSLGGIAGGMNQGVSGVLVLVYVIFAALYVMPVIYLFKFSDKMKQALELSDQFSLSAAFLNLKSHFKYVGIVAICVMALYIIVIIAAIGMGVSGLM